MRKGSDLRIGSEALTMMIVSDEAWFYLTLPINKPKDQTWSKEKPLEYIERPQKVIISLKPYSKCRGRPYELIKMF